MSLDIARGDRRTSARLTRPLLIGGLSVLLAAASATPAFADPSGSPSPSTTAPSSPAPSSPAPSSPAPASPSPTSPSSSSPSPSEASPSASAEPSPTATATATPPAPSIAGRPLREVAAEKGIQVGAAIATGPFAAGDQQFLDVLAQQYDTVVAENFTKWDTIQPTRDTFDFTLSDKMVDFAIAHHMKVRWAPVAWYNQRPGWLSSITSRDEALQVAEKYVKTVVTRYKGKLDTVEAVNEPLEPTGARRSATQSWWEGAIGPDYINHVFTWVHEADPAVKIYLNDYDNEPENPKSNAQYRIVADLLAAKVPIDGVGFQVHQPSSWRLTDSFRRNANRFAALGLDIAITEFDSRVPLPVTEEKLATQAQSYADIALFCREQPRCKMLNTWGFTDKYSWVPEFFSGYGAALPLDENYAAKPAFEALRTGLAASPTAAPPAVRILGVDGRTGSLDINWAGQVGATGYTVTVTPATGSAAAKTVDVPAQNSLTVTGLTDGATYHVTVKGKNSFGTGPASATVDGKPVNGKPAAPVFSSFVGGNTVATATWEPVTGATGYLLTYGEAGAATTQTLDLGDATSVRLTALVNGKSYTATVAAYNANGTGPASAARTAQVAKKDVLLRNQESATDITVDGKLTEKAWNKLPISVSDPVVGTPDNTTTAALSWDDTNLYVAAKVLDDDLCNDSTDTYQDDAVEIYLDGNGDGKTVYDRRYDRQFFYGYGDETFAEQAGLTAGVTAAQTKIPGGWATEFAIPWSSIGQTPRHGLKFGIDIGNDDDDRTDGTCGDREGQDVAYGIDANYADLSNLATVSLATRTATTERAVTPFAQCMTTAADGTKTATFGYVNDNDGRFAIAVAPRRNAAAPAPIDRGQPRIFVRGRHENAVEVPLTAGAKGKASWTLRGADGRVRTATATAAGTLKACPAKPADVTLYGESLAAGWTTFTFNATADLDQATTVKTGTKAAAITVTGAYGLFGTETTAPLTTTAGTAVTFWVHGGSGTGTRLLQVTTGEGETSQPWVPIEAPAGAWTKITVTGAQLGRPAKIGRVIVQDRSGAAGSQPAFFLDDLTVTAVTPAVAPAG